MDVIRDRIGHIRWPECPCDFGWLCYKLQMRATWVIVMVLMALADLAANWFNLRHLSKPELEYGLVIGPPSRVLWILLFVFTCLRSVAFILETINTLSAICNGGITRVPLVIEQIIILSLVGVPLAAVNYFITRCRHQHNTGSQSLCGIFVVLYVLLRLLWYAHIEGKRMTACKDGTVQMQKGMFMGVCVLYTCTMAFPVVAWRDQTSVQMTETLYKDVRIFFLKAPFKRTDVLYNYSLLQLREAEGPFVIAPLKRVIRSDPSGFNASWTCPRNVTFSPSICEADGGARIFFNIRYIRTSQVSPFGEIHFGSALARGDGTCTASALPEDWQLYFLQVVPVVKNQLGNVTARTPWAYTCTTTRPRYDHRITVC